MTTAAYLLLDALLKEGDAVVERVRELTEVGPNVERALRDHVDADAELDNALSSMK